MHLIDRALGGHDNLKPDLALQSGAVRPIRVVRHNLAL
tara:strand:- start:65 stop:178 length:114 start_codon:yes stop_codon:yes gene_type:complete